MKGVESRGWSVGVVVPARNEAATIAECIRGIVASADASACLKSLWVVIVADACTDDTAQQARRALGTQGQVLICSAHSAGTARRIGVAAALTHFREVDAGRIWLANTDADTCVPPDWIDIHLQLANGGSAAVAGIVQLDAAGCAEAHALYRDTYVIRPDGTHSHVHGANLAMRADAYLDAGGWYDQHLAEDHCLWSRLRSRGWRVSAAARSVVVTSARLRGRAAGGFADTLKSNIARHRAAP